VRLVEESREFPDRALVLRYEFNDASRVRSPSNRKFLAIRSASPGGAGSLN
jgi:hypothetical protein